MEISLTLRQLLNEPAVRGRLGDLHAPDLRVNNSGALMAHGTWDGAPAIAKIGMPEYQLRWTREVARVDPSVLPALYASGDTLAGEPRAWLLMERCPHVLGWQFHDVGYRLLMEAGVRFQRATRLVGPCLGPADVDLERFTTSLRETFTTSDIPPPDGAERLADNVERDLEWVLATCEVEQCHGDLHPSNAVLRVTPPDPAAQALLVDVSSYVIPWAYEGSYCEIIWWHAPIPDGHPTMTHAMAAIRRRFGMSVPSDEDIHRLSTLYRGWHALRAWPRAPHRYHVPDYEAAARAYIKEAAALSGSLG